MALCGISPVLASKVHLGRFARAAPRSDVIALIKRMAAENRLWGAERIRGELLKLRVRVAKRTVQRYMRGARTRAGYFDDPPESTALHATRR